MKKLPQYSRHRSKSSCLYLIYNSTTMPSFKSFRSYCASLFGCGCPGASVSGSDGARVSRTTFRIPKCLRRLRRRRNAGQERTKKEEVHEEEECTEQVQIEEVNEMTKIEEEEQQEKKEYLDEEEEELCLFLQLEQMVKDEEKDEEEKDKNQNMSLFLELHKIVKMQEDKLQESQHSELRVKQGKATSVKTCEGKTRSRIPLPVAHFGISGAGRCEARVQRDNTFEGKKPSRIPVPIRTKKSSAISSQLKDEMPEKEQKEIQESDNMDKEEKEQLEQMVKDNEKKDSIQENQTRKKEVKKTHSRIPVPIPHFEMRCEGKIEGNKATSTKTFEGKKPSRIPVSISARKSSTWNTQLKGEMAKLKEEEQQEMNEKEEMNKEEEKEQDELSEFLALEEQLDNEETQVQLENLSAFFELEHLMEKKKEEQKEEGNETDEEEQDELSLFLQLEQMFKDEEMDEEENQAAEEEIKKPRRKVSFNFDNLTSTIKERELYRGREYFRFFKPLSVLRPALCPQKETGFVDATSVKTCESKTRSRIPVPVAHFGISGAGRCEARVQRDNTTSVKTFEGKKPSRIPVPIWTKKSSTGNTLARPQTKGEMLKLEKEERKEMNEKEEMNEEKKEEQDELSLFLALGEQLEKEEQDELSLFLQLEQMVKDEEREEKEQDELSVFLALGEQLEKEEQDELSLFLQLEQMVKDEEREEEEKEGLFEFFTLAELMDNDETQDPMEQVSAFFQQLLFSFLY